MRTRHILHIASLVVLLATGTASADIRTLEFDLLTGSYTAGTGEFVRHESKTVPEIGGSVSRAIVRASGTYVPGKTIDAAGESATWDAGMAVFFHAADRVTWAEVELRDGAFDIVATVTELTGEESEGWDSLAGESIIVEVMLLADSVNGRTIVAHPILELDDIAVELHSVVARENASWGDLKALYR